MCSRKDGHQLVAACVQVVALGIESLLIQQAAGPIVALMPVKPSHQASRLKLNYLEAAAALPDDLRLQAWQYGGPQVVLTAKHRLC